VALARLAGEFGQIFGRGVSKVGHRRRA
jgi:hypothetical protein